MIRDSIPRPGRNWHARPGAVALITMIGMTMLSLTMVLVLIDVATREEAKSRNNYQSERAFAAANACLEYTLRLLNENSTWVGYYDGSGGGDTHKLRVGPTSDYAYCYHTIVPSGTSGTVTVFGDCTNSGAATTEGKCGTGNVEQRKIVVQYDAAGGSASPGFDVDVALVVDRSKSMSKVNPATGRTALQDLQTAANAFIDEMKPTDRITIVTYSYGGAGCAAGSGCFAQEDIGLTFADVAGKTSLHAKINGLTEFGQTNIEHALYLAKEELKIPPARGAPVQRAIVLMSDGAANYSYEPGPVYPGCVSCPSNDDVPPAPGTCLAPQEAIDLASIVKGTIPVYTIGYNLDTLDCPTIPPQDPNIDEVRAIAENTLRQMASTPTAKYFYSADNANIESIYKQIAGVILGGMTITSWQEQ